MTKKGKKSKESVIKHVEDKHICAIFDSYTLPQLFSLESSTSFNGSLFTDAGIITLPIPHPLPPSSNLTAFLDSCNDETPNKSKFAINIPLDTILPLVSTSLHSGRPIVAQLYKLNIYGPGGHFMSHVDTPRSADMVGTLVVSLPVAHEGGDMTITHKGHSTVFKTSNDGSENEVRWAAFYGDCEHAIGEVISGYRITVSYALLEMKTPISVVNFKTSVDDSLLAFIKQMQSQSWIRDTEGGGEGMKGKMLLYCSQSYTTEELQEMASSQSVSHLVGMDWIMAMLLKSMKLNISVFAVDCFEKVQDVLTNRDYEPYHKRGKKEEKKTTLPTALETDWEVCKIDKEEGIEAYDVIPNKPLEFYESDQYTDELKAESIFNLELCEEEDEGDGGEGDNVGEDEGEEESEEEESDEKEVKDVSRILVANTSPNYKLWPATLVGLRAESDHKSAYMVKYEAAAAIMVHSK